MRRLPLICALIISTGLASFWTATEASARTQVYFLRGLFDVSTGLDGLAAKLKRKRISSSIGNHAVWNSFAEHAIRNYNRRKVCKIVIIGHSLGADAAITMARKLRAASVPVALIVNFSPFVSKSVPSNVSSVVNYYQSNSSWNNVYSREGRARTRIRNIDLAAHGKINHFNIERVPRLHARTIRAIQRAKGRCRRR